MEPTNETDTVDHLNLKNEIITILTLFCIQIGSYLVNVATDEKIIKLLTFLSLIITIVYTALRIYAWFADRKKSVRRRKKTNLDE